MVWIGRDSLYYPRLPRAASNLPLKRFQGWTSTHSYVFSVFMGSLFPLGRHWRCRDGCCGIFVSKTWREKPRLCSTLVCSAPREQSEWLIAWHHLSDRSLGKKWTLNCLKCEICMYQSGKFCAEPARGFNPVGATCFREEQVEGMCKTTWQHWESPTIILSENENIPVLFIYYKFLLPVKR